MQSSQFIFQILKTGGTEAALLAKTTNIGLNLLFIGKIKHIIQLYKTPKTLYSPNQTILNVDFEQ